MGTFNQAIQICGLDDLEASQFFGVPLSTINDWSCKSQMIPSDVWNMLAARFHHILSAGDSLSALLNDYSLQLDALDEIEAPNTFLKDGISLPDQSARKMAGAAGVLISVFDNPLQ